MHSYDSVESLIDGERESNIHVECSRPVTMRALDTVRRLYGNRRCAFYLRSDRGFDRDSVRSYLRFFGALAGTGADAEAALDHFGLRPVASKRIGKLDDEQRAMTNFARMSLFDPEVCFIEYPLGYLGSARALIDIAMDRGGQRARHVVHHDGPAVARCAADARHGVVDGGRPVHRGADGNR